MCWLILAKITLLYDDGTPISIVLALDFGKEVKQLITANFVPPATKKQNTVEPSVIKTVGIIVPA